MSRLPSRRAVFVAIAVLGAYSQIVQALLIRESLVVFYGNEVSLGAFYGSWLLWIALGSLALLRWRERPWVRRPLPLLRALLLVLPLLLAAQIVGLHAVRWLLDVSPTQFVPLGQLFAALALATLPSSAVIGLAFPLASRALRWLAARGGDAAVVRDVSWLYVAEAAGALGGGVLFTFVLIHWFGVWRTLGLVGVALAWTVHALTPQARRPLRAALAGLALAALALLATPLARPVGQAMERLRFATLQPGLTLLDAVETRYGHRAIARLGNQYSLVVDGHIAASFPLPRATAQAAAYFYSQTRGARRVLLFDGLASGLAAELLRYPVQRLDVVLEPDRRAFDMLRPYLPPATRRALRDPRLHLHFADGRHFANRLPADAGYDLVLVPEAVPTSAYANRYFTVEFYRHLARAMPPEGVFCTQVSSASNYLGSEVRSYTGSVFHTLRRVFPRVALRPGDEVVFCASRRPDVVSEDPAVLAARYRAVPLAERRFPPEGFQALLPAGRVAWLHRRLAAEAGEINTDATPVTYYLNMLLWGRFSASWVVGALEALRHLGPGPYLVPFAVFLLLWMGHHAAAGTPRPRPIRQAATLALVVLGLVAMAVQLTLLFSYQSHVGYIFSRIALLNGLFMSGLALGAGGVGQRLARSPRADAHLAMLLAAVAGALWALPALLARLGDGPGGWQEGAYLALCLTAGLLTGIGFPLGVAAAQRDTGEVVATAGLTEAADHLGGALGGLLTGALLVPLLGVAGTSRLLAVLALGALLPLGFARLAPRRVGPLAARAHRAFPWPWLAWLLAFAVLTQYGWALLRWAAAPPPRVHFDTRVLEEVSGSRAFQERAAPFVHYLGADRAEQLPGQAQTVSLSTLAAAPEVRGYAGPINLLLALDRSGRLLGVRYIDSNETPSYIAGIEAWLAGLAGQDLAERGLDLERVDALSGATVTSRAALAAINRSARAAGRVAFGRRFAGAGQERAAPAWRRPKFLLTLALLLAFFPIYLSGSEGARLALLAASLALLGLGYNTLVTEVDLINLSQGHWPSWQDNPQRWLLLGFVAVGGLLFGQVWCGYLCPFGAVQEFLSRLGRRLRLRRYARRPLDTRLRFLKFVLLALLLPLVWWTGDARWLGFNPMQYAFAPPWHGWPALILALAVAGALFFVRFWCRYLCPMGALLALTNKLALLQGRAPPRRFDHCDLGVRDEYDIDCIRCNRCLSGRDYGVRPPRRRGKPEGGP